MRIVVVDIAARGGGADTILESLRQFADGRVSSHDWFFLLAHPSLTDTDRLHTILVPVRGPRRLHRLVFDLSIGRRRVNAIQPDVVLSLQNTRILGVQAPQVVYVHQPVPFQRTRSFSFRRRDERTLALYQHVIGRIIKRSLRSADAVVVQTRWMRDAVRDQVRIAPARVVNILPDVEDLSSYVSSLPLDPRAFLCPTSAWQYKNNSVVVQACRLLRAEGVTDFRVRITVDAPINDPNVESTGFIPRPELLEELSRSTLVFPSLIESYGLPPAEARALGTVVLAADLSYAREVLAGYPDAHFFDPRDARQLAALMRGVIEGRVTGTQSPAVRGAAGGGGTVTAWERVLQVLSDCAHGEEMRDETALDH